MSNLQRFYSRSTQWVYRIGVLVLLGSIPKLRLGAGAGERKIKIPPGIRWSEAEADGLRCEWLTPPEAHAQAAVLYLHGGGGVLGLYNSHRWMVSYMALACKLPFLLPDYRLAPEHPFPAGLEDCVTAYRWLLAEGFAPQRLAIAGDSAGGWLTISLLLALRDQGLPQPGAAVFISPSTDPTCSGKSFQANARKDALLSPKFALTMTKHYVASHDLSDPVLSPLTADLRGLPPMLIQAGEDEILLDDSVRLHERAQAAGVNARLEVWQGMWHVWHACVPGLPEANRAIDQIAEFVNR